MINDQNTSFITVVVGRCLEEWFRLVVVDSGSECWWRVAVVQIGNVGGVLDRWWSTVQIGVLVNRVGNYGGIQIHSIDKPTA